MTRSEKVDSKLKRWALCVHFISDAVQKFCPHVDEPLLQCITVTVSLCVHRLLHPGPDMTVNQIVDGTFGQPQIW